MNEIVYKGHDNWIDLILKADGAAVDLASVTRVTLTLGTTLVDSDNGAPDPIRWAQAGYATGQLKLKLGGLTLTAGNYRGALVVYDATNVNGIVWGIVPILVMADPEAAGT